MTQFARPDATLITGAWAASSTTQHGDTSDQSDLTYITAGGSSTAITLNLSDVTDPASAADHTIVVRMRASGSGGPERFNLQLYQGSTTVIAAPFSNQAVTRGTGWTEYTYTLVAFEADSITDYTDLRIRIEPSGLKAGETIDASEVYFQVPSLANAELTVADITSGPTVDAVTLSQTHILTVADWSTVVTADGVILDQQGQPLTVADMSAEVDITPRILADTDGEQLVDTDSELLTDDPLELAQTHILTVQDISSTPTIDQLVIGVVFESDAVSTDNTAEATIDSVALTQTHILTVADATAGATIDGDLDIVVTFEVSQLPGGGVAAVATVDSFALTQTHILTVADARAETSADNVLSSPYLVINDASASVTMSAFVAPVLVVSDARTIGRVRDITLEGAADLVVDDWSVVTTADADLLLEQFFTGQIGLELDTRSLSLTLDTRSLGLTLDTRTDG